MDLQGRDECGICFLKILFSTFIQLWFKQLHITFIFPMDSTVGQGRNAFWKGSLLLV